MNKIIPLLLVLAFLTASCVIAVKPVSAASQNSWTTKAPMQVARSDLGVIAANDKIYAIGGNTESGYIPNSHGNDYKALGWIVATNEEYDPATNKWTFKKPMPTPRYNFAIAAYQNKIYCIGGITNWVSGQINFTGVNEVYDPATDTWETKAPMPTATSAKANVVGGRIYLIGGGSNETLNQAYDPATNSWTIKTPMPVAPKFQGPPNKFSALVSAVVDNKIYIMGGSSFPSFSLINQIYAPETDTWSQGSPIPSGIWDGEATATTGVNAPKRIYVFDETGTQIYNPTYDRWTFGVTIPTSRQNFGVAVLNDTFYAIGGRTYNYPFPGDNYFTVTEETLNEQYAPIGYGRPDPSYDGAEPEIAVLSPKNLTYYTTDVPLNFTVNEPGSWMHYRLDGNTAVEIEGNATLSGLSYGAHSITVYATDTAGNTGTSETINFTIAEEPEPFPTAPVAAASIASVAVVATAMLIYFKKRKH